MGKNKNRGTTSKRIGRGLSVAALIGMALGGCEVGDDGASQGASDDKSTPCITVPPDRPLDPQEREPGAAGRTERICDPGRGRPDGTTLRAPDAGGWWPVPGQPR
jgi:hypothetical protein